MASNAPGACCASGFRHEGTPVGETKNIGGGKLLAYPASQPSILTTTPVDTYVVYPKDNKTPEKAVVFLTDIIGIYNNSQLLADEFANNGYLTVVPDLFQGDPIKLGDMETGKADLPAWIGNHQPANVDPVVESTVKYLRQDLGVKKIGGVGYCFGGKVGLPCCRVIWT